MQVFWTLMRRELGAQFLSWTGYVVMAAVVFLLGASFSNLMQSINHDVSDRPLTELFYVTYYFWLILVLVAPVITMRTFALEKSTGTFETLMTAPVSDVQVVLAKFAAALAFYVLMWLPLVACLFFVQRYTPDAPRLDAGTLAAIYLGIVLLGAVFVSLGCFASALTRSQANAAIVSLAGAVSLLLLSFLAKTFAGASDWRSQLFHHVGLIDRMEDFARGVVDTRPLALCLSLTLFFLFLTFKVVESRRWK